MRYLATRLAAVKPSASMAASLAARALRAEGHGVIDLGLGEPDFPNQAHVAKVSHAAARRGKTLYTAAAGTLALRTAVAPFFRISTATSDAMLIEAMARVARAVANLTEAA